MPSLQLFQVEGNSLTGGGCFENCETIVLQSIRIDNLEGLSWWIDLPILEKIVLGENAFRGNPKLQDDEQREKISLVIRSRKWIYP